MSLFKTRKDVSVQDQYTAPFKFTCIRYDKEDITLTAPAIIDANKVAVSAGHGFNINDDIVLYENGLFNQSIVTAVNTNEITLHNYLDKTYSLAAKVIRGNRFMNVNGSLEAPVEFKFKCFENTRPIDLYKLVLCFQSGTNKPDDGNFGGITAITNGLIIRRKINGYRSNFGCYRMNKDFKDYGAYINYTEKGAGGTYGTDVDISIKDYGVAVRVGFSLLDETVILVRDNLTSLSLFTMSILGHYTLGEL